MRGIVAKRLKGKPEKRLTMRLRRVFKRSPEGKVVLGENNKPITYDLAGTVRHQGGTTSSVYQKLKKKYKESR